MREVTVEVKSTVPDTPAGVSVVTESVVNGLWTRLDTSECCELASGTDKAKVSVMLADGDRLVIAPWGPTEAVVNRDQFVATAAPSDSPVGKQFAKAHEKRMNDRTTVVDTAVRKEQKAAGKPVTGLGTVEEAPAKPPVPPKTVKSPKRVVAKRAKPKVRAVKRRAKK